MAEQTWENYEQELVRTAMERGREEGIEKGREEERERAQEEKEREQEENRKSQQETLLALLEDRFDNVSTDVREKIKQASLKVVQSCIRNVL